MRWHVGSFELIFSFGNNQEIFPKCNLSKSDVYLTSALLRKYVSMMITIQAFYRHSTVPTLGVLHDVLHKPHGKGVKKGDTAQKDQNIPFSSGFYKF